MLICIHYVGISAGGVDVLNLVPSTATAKLDIRIAPHIPPSDIADTLDLWCQEVTRTTPGLPPQGGGVTWSFIGAPLMQHHTTVIDPTTTTATSTSATTDVDSTLAATTATTTAATDSNNNNNTNNSSDNNSGNNSKERGENQKWLTLIQHTLHTNFNILTKPEIFPAATDSRFLRALGIRAFGFSPMRNSSILLHEHDEYIDSNVYIEGCEVYIELIKAISSVVSFD